MTNKMVSHNRRTDSPPFRQGRWILCNRNRARSNRGCTIRGTDFRRSEKFEDLFRRPSQDGPVPGHDNRAFDEEGIPGHGCNQRHLIWQGFVHASFRASFQRKS
ncbi:MAG: hypothetical protein FD153_1289 [Rhodospirillaceae bacterium]|nr:MAG: hypothetical protein FD153_1289 [Rhodospirillaceae bacterium]